jgi:hypothetical protein
VICLNLALTAPVGAIHESFRNIHRSKHGGINGTTYKKIFIRTISRWVDNGLNPIEGCVSLILK